MNWEESVSIVRWEPAMACKAALSEFTHRQLFPDELCFETNLLFQMIKKINCS